MKKIVLLFTLLCAGHLYGMKRLRPTEKTEEKLEAKELEAIWEALLEDVKPLIIMASAEGDEDLDTTIYNIIKVSLINKQLNEMINEKYGNLPGFTALVHTLAKKFNKSTKTIAEKFKTPTAEQYIQLSQNLLKAVKLNTIDEVAKLIKQGADVNYGTGYAVTKPLDVLTDTNYYDAQTPLFFAVMLSDHEIAKLLLNAGAIPKPNDYYRWPRDKNSADEMKQLIEEGREKELQ